MKRKRKGDFALTVLDLVLTVLVAAAVLSTVFYDQIHAFLQEEDNLTLEYTFVVQNVTEASVNLPAEGEELYELESQVFLGLLVDLQETQHSYQNEDDELVVSTLTCKAAAEGVMKEDGVTVSGLKIKPGMEYTVKTASASFKMTIITVKTVED